jgi:taurine transport system permease protein
MMSVSTKDPAAGVTQSTAPPSSARRPRIPRRLLIGSGALVLMLGVWWLIASLRLWDPVFVPSPAAVWNQLLRTSTEHDGVRGYGGYLLMEHLWVSVRRILLSSAIAILIGVPVGIAIALVPLLRDALGPAITFLRQLPPLAYFSLLIIWFGIDETPKLVLLVIAAMPPVIVSTAAGIESVHRDYINGARSLGAGQFALIRFVLFPASLPDVFTGIRLGIGVAYTSVVAAETVNGVPGLGGMIRDAQRYNQTDLVILGILVLGLTGLVLEGILTWLQRRTTPWRGLA